MYIKIENFMCHSFIEHEFNGLSIISGKNGSGKSAIFHALNWAISGGTNNFIKIGTKECAVQIDGIKRISGKKYSVLLNGEEICTNKSPLDELGIDFPVEFYSQFDRLFLLNETPKVRADILNDMFEIEKLELAFSNVKDDIKLLENSQEIVKNNIDSVTEAIKINELEKNILEEGIVRIKRLELVLQKLTEIGTIKPTIYVEKIEQSMDIFKNLDILKKLEEISELKIVKIVDKIVGDIDYNILDKLNILDSIKTIDNAKLLEEISEIDKKLIGGVCPCCNRRL